MPTLPKSNVATGPRSSRRTPCVTGRWQGGCGVEAIQFGVGMRYSSQSPAWRVGPIGGSPTRPADKLTRFRQGAK